MLVHDTGFWPNTVVVLSVDDQCFQLGFVLSRYGSQGEQYA